MIFQKTDRSRLIS